MNPFALPGPAFLLFYLVFGILVCLVLRTKIKRIETSADVTRLPMAGDPYLIACLRGGPKEAAKVATIALVDRNLLSYNGKTLSTVSPDAARLVQRGIEREILTRYLVPGTPQALLANADVLASCRQYQLQLEDHELVASPPLALRRMRPALIALVVLLGCTLIKVGYAFAYGHTNVFFLLLLSATFSIQVLWQMNRRTSFRGLAQLEDLRALFARLKQRAHSLVCGGATNEMALVAAVFGIGILPAVVFPYVRQLYGTTPGDGSGSGGGDSSSSCGSSSGGSSCSSGSSCGGGGGCGGCGS